MNLPARLIIWAPSGRWITAADPTDSTLPRRTMMTASLRACLPVPSIRVAPTNAFSSAGVWVRPGPPAKAESSTTARVPSILLIRSINFIGPLLMIMRNFSHLGILLIVFISNNVRRLAFPINIGLAIARDVNQGRRFQESKILRLHQRDETRAGMEPDLPVTIWTPRHLSAPIDDSGFERRRM